MGFLSAALLVVVAAAVLPPLMNHAALSQEEAALAPSNTSAGTHVLVSALGSTLHVHCIGAGSPSVLLEAPAGTGGASLLQPLLPSLLTAFNAKTPRNGASDDFENIKGTVCVYDRAGLAGSGIAERVATARAASVHASGGAQGGPPPRKSQAGTAERASEDLYAVLHGVQLPRPRVVVGVGYGALVARFAAQLYEGEIDGLVLLDPLSEVLFAQQSAKPETKPRGATSLTGFTERWSANVVRAQDAAFLAALAGVRRLELLATRAMQAANAALLAETAPAEAPTSALNLHLACSFNHNYAAALEHRMANESAAQVGHLSRLRPLPAGLPVRIALRPLTPADILLPLPRDKAASVATAEELRAAAQRLAQHLGAPPPAYVTEAAQLASIVDEIFMQLSDKPDTENSD